MLTAATAAEKRKRSVFHKWNFWTLSFFLTSSWILLTYTSKPISHSWEDLFLPGMKSCLSLTTAHLSLYEANPLIFRDCIALLIFHNTSFGTFAQSLTDFCTAKDIWCYQVDIFTLIYLSSDQNLLSSSICPSYFLQRVLHVDYGGHSLRASSSTWLRWRRLRLASTEADLSTSNRQREIKKITFSRGTSRCLTSDVL